MSAEMIQALALPAIMIAFVYFGMIRPQKKKDKQIEEMRSQIKVGDDIVTIGGIVGKVLVVKDDLITIETGAPKSRIELYKWSINTKITK